MCRYLNAILTLVRCVMPATATEGLAGAEPAAAPGAVVVLEAKVVREASVAAKRYSSGS